MEQVLLIAVGVRLGEGGRQPVVMHDQIGEQRPALVQHAGFIVRRRIGKAGKGVHEVAQAGGVVHRFSSMEFLRAGRVQRI